MSFKFNPFTGTLDIVGNSTPPVVSAAENLTVNWKNDSGSTIAILTPVITDSSGGMTTINVSTITEKRVMGVASQSISNGSFGTVIISGQLENITTSFLVGETLYIDKTGALSNTIPSVGVGGFVSGDALIKAGDLVINSTTPSQKDFVIKFELIVIL